jgi:hypothetical protein
VSLICPSCNSRPSQNTPRSAGTEARLLLLAAVINAALFTITLSFLTPGFDTNDDVGMASIASGVLTGKPSQDLVVSSVLIGYVLKLLYQWTDRVNWYTFYLLAVHFATMTGLLYAFLRARFSRTSVVLFVLLFSQFEVSLLLWLQYTSVAVIAGIVGLLLVIVSNRPGAEKSRFATGYGALLIVLSGIIRANSMYYAVVLLVPFLVFELAIHRRWRTFAQIGAILAVALVPIAYNDWHYRSDASWRTFRQTHALVGSLLDSPMVEYNEKTRFFFDRIGWSRNDWEMLQSWFYTDPEVYSPAHLATIVDQFQGSNWGRIGSSAYRAESLETVSVVRTLMYANVLLAMLLARGVRLRVSLIGLTQCLLVEILLVDWSLYMKLVGRVMVPAFFATTVILFFIERRAAGERRFLITLPTGTSVRRLSAAVAIVFCLFYAGLCYRVTADHLMASESNRRNQRAFQTFVRTVDSRYVARNPAALFVNWGGVWPAQFISPFDDFRSMRRLPMISLGWWLRSPPSDDQLRRLGISNLYRELYENPNIYLFASPTQLKFLSQFVQEHYQQRISIKRNDVYLVNADSDATWPLGVYQLTAATGPPDLFSEKSPMPRIGTPGKLP